jgi:hypothetical protein
MDSEGLVLAASAFGDTRSPLASMLACRKRNVVTGLI